MIYVICRKKNRSTRYNLFFGYNKNMIDLIKEIDHDLREWDKKSRCWILGANTLLEFIKTFKGRKDIFFDFESEEKKTEFRDNIKKEQDKVKQKEERIQFSLKKQESAKNLKLFLKDNYHIVEYKKYLKDGIIPFPHQIIGAKFANEIGSSIIAADMGTGKTLLALLASEMKGGEYKKILVIVPNSLKLNWRNEVNNFTHSKSYILHGDYIKKNKFTIEESRYVITNYEFFRSSAFNPKVAFKKFGFDTNDVDCIVFDEAHRIKNTKSNTTKNILKTFKKLNLNYMLLSGTIMPNRIEELYVCLNLILPDEFPNKQSFFENYCGKKFIPDVGWIEEEEIDLDKLHDKLSGIMYRVKKSEVLKDLPEMTISKIEIEMSKKEQSEYDKIENQMSQVDWDNFDENINLEDVDADPLNPLTILTRLRQYTSKIKSEDSLIDFIKNLNNQNEKVVIFDIYKDNLKILAEKFSHNSAYYGGSVSVDDRQELVDRFQDPNSDLMNLFITKDTGKEGITLTASSKLVLLTQSHVPGENEQMYARIHRIGAKYNVNIYIFTIENTIDNMVYHSNNNKQMIISKVIDNEKFVDTNEKSPIKSLLEYYRTKYDK